MTAGGTMRTGLWSLMAMAAGVVGVSGVALPTASAQQVRVTSRLNIGGPGSSGEISKRSLDAYIAMLGLSDDQAAAARTIYDGYSAEYRQAVDTQRQALMQAQRKAEDTGDQSMFIEKLPEIQKEFREKSQKTEAGFFRDLKDLLSPEQDAKWPRVERARRREVGLRGQSLSGAGVDIVALLRDQHLPEGVMTGLAEPIEQYEQELDRVLKDAERLRDSSDMPDVSKGLDLAKLQEQSKSWREIGLRLQEVNERTRAKIDGMLPEDARSAFSQAYLRAAMPLVYRPARVMRELDSVLKMSDVSPEQREKLASIKARYQKEAAGLNSAWAAALRSSEQKDQGGAAVVLPGGGQMLMKTDDDPQDLRDARKARSDLDDKTGESLRSLLTQAQKDRLEAQAQDEEGDGPRQMMMIRATDDSPPKDSPK